jgi:hypothetical protein
MYIRQHVEPAGISLGLGWLGDLAAAPDEAEARRWKDEMTKLAQGTKERGPSWSGVERTYRKWFEVRPGEDWEVYSLAAQAAGQLGDGTARYLRLRRALAANPPPNAVRDLTSMKEDLEVNWAHVDIRFRGRATGELQPVGGLPFAGPEREAILRAQGELKASWKFQGLLPAISYLMDGHNIPLKDDLSISRVSLVIIRQKSDGSFQLRSQAGPWNPRESKRQP